MGDGKGNFAVTQTFAVGTSPSSSAAADFNGDDTTDLVVTNYASATVSVVLGKRGGDFEAQRPDQPRISPEHCCQNHHSTPANY
jgi:hypothetical protein